MQFEFSVVFFADNYVKCIADQVVSLTSDHSRVDILPVQTRPSRKTGAGLAWNDLPAAEWSGINCFRRSYINTYPNAMCSLSYIDIDGKNVRAMFQRMGCTTYWLTEIRIGWNEKLNMRDSVSCSLLISLQAIR